MFKRVIGMLALSCTMVFSQGVFADCGEGLKHMLQSFKLDDAQKAKLGPVMDQLKASLKENVPQMVDLDKQIQQMATSDKMDQSAVDSLIDQKTKLIGNLMKAKITAKNQIMGILTDKQKATLKDMMVKAEEKMAAKFKSCHDQDMD